MQPKYLQNNQKIRDLMTESIGLANNTKWCELQKIMSELGSRAPYWRTYATNGFLYPLNGWDGDWSYPFRLGEYKHIETCEISPRLTKSSLSFEDCVSTCKSIGFEIETLPEANIIRILGYQRI